MRSAVLRIAVLVLVGLLLFAAVSQAVAQTVPFPRITISAGSAKEPQETALAIQILLLLTVLTLAPAILIASSQESDLPARAMDAGFHAILIKPLADRLVLDAVRGAVGLARTIDSGAAR